MAKITKKVLTKIKMDLFNDYNPNRTTNKGHIIYARAQYKNLYFKWKPDQGLHVGLKKYSEDFNAHALQAISALLDNVTPEILQELEELLEELYDNSQS